MFRSSSTRYLIGVGALALMFASFGVTFALLSDPPAGGDGLAAVMAPSGADVAPAPLSDYTAAPAAWDAAPERDFAWVARAWLVGVCLLAGQMWARVVGVILAFASAIINVGFLPSYPVWSGIMIALDVIVIWAITVHGGELKEFKQ